MEPENKSRCISIAFYVDRKFDYLGQFVYLIVGQIRMRHFPNGDSNTLDRVSKTSRFYHLSSNAKSIFAVNLNRLEFIPQFLNISLDIMVPDSK